MEEQVLKSPRARGSASSWTMAALSPYPQQNQMWTKLPSSSEWPLLQVTRAHRIVIVTRAHRIGAALHRCSCIFPCGQARTSWLHVARANAVGEDYLWSGAAAAHGSGRDFSGWNR
eukprot:scaffold110015_cov36-Tisochrysis_lutea.AAC.1